MPKDLNVNVSNYHKTTGDWVIGGILQIVTGGQILPESGVQPVIAALTNNSGGTSGGNTIAAVTDVPSAANAIATLAAKVNALQAAIKAVGISG